MRARYISTRFQKVLIIAICWTLFLTFAYVNSYLLISDLVGWGKLSGDYAFWPDFWGNFVLGMLGGLFGGAILVYKLNSGYRQRSFLSGILNSALVFILLYLLFGVVALFLMGFIYFAFREGVTLAYHRAMDNLITNVVTPSYFFTINSSKMCLFHTKAIPS